MKQILRSILVCEELEVISNETKKKNGYSTRTKKTGSGSRSMALIEEKEVH